MLLAAPDPSAKILGVLTANFESSPPSVQTRVLREIGILSTDGSIPFLASVAVDDRFPNDVRREALKAILATDGTRYRAVLEPLKPTEVETGSVILAFLEIGDPRFAETFVRRGARKDLDARSLRVSVTAALDLWDGKKEGRPPFSLWKNGDASRQLLEIVSESSGTRKRRGVAALGWVRDAASTQALIRLLNDPDAVVAASALEGLGNPGGDASPALGRFLLRSNSPELRKVAIQSLRKRKSDASRRALEAYRPKATAEERALVEAALR